MCARSLVNYMLSWPSLGPLGRRREAHRRASDPHVEAPEAPGRVRGGPQTPANSMWKRHRPTRLVIRASSTHFTQASAAKMGCARDPSQITCFRGSSRGPWVADIRLTGVLRAPMWRPQTLQGGFEEGHKPSRIACGSVIGPPKSSSELPPHTSRKQVPRKWDVRAIPRKLHALVALPAASGTST